MTSLQNEVMNKEDNKAEKKNADTNAIVSSVTKQRGESDTGYNFYVQNKRDKLKEVKTQR